MLEPFERAPRPAWHRPYRLRERWWTWSDDAQHFLRRHLRDLELLRLERIRVGSSNYPMSLVPRDGRRLRTLLATVAPFARNLAKTTVTTEPLFLQGLLRPGISSKAIAHFLALLARAMNERTRQAPPAMFVPPNPSPVSSDFLLHSDLFPARRLFIVYDQVAAPQWSASLLLPWSRAFSPLERAGVAAHARALMRKLLLNPIGNDGFDRLFDLLYDDYSAVGERVIDGLQRAACCVRFRRGEGYRARFRRLVF
jgi:hypothetical protein